MSPVKRAVETWLTVSSFLILGLIAMPIKLAAQQPIVVTGPVKQIGTLGGTYGGGWDNGADPIGGSFAVGANGNVIVGDGYGLGWLDINPSGTQPSNESVLATFASTTEQPGAASAVDAYGNVYVASAAVWSSAAYVFKLPYNAAAGTYAGFTSSTIPTSNCLGGTQDTSACIFASAVPGALTKGYSAGFADIAFDAQGNFYFSTDTQSENNSPNTIYECVASSLPACSSPTLVYADSSPMGAMAIDPWGNLFFIDGASTSVGTSYLKEIPAGGWSSSTPASTTTTLETYASSAAYNSLAGLVIASNGTIYFSNNDGIFAIPNTSTNGPNTSAVYVVSTPGGKGLALDANGNLYEVDLNNNVDFVPINNFSLGSVATGTAATAIDATIFDGSGSCSPIESVAVTEFGVTSSEFTATAGTTCSAGFTPSNGTFSSGPLSASSFGSSYSVALNFTPSAAGERNAALTITDSTNNVSGVSQLFGVGQFEWPLLDPGAATAYTAQLASPSSVVADAAGDVFVADTGNKGVYEFTASNPSSATLIIGSSSSPAIASPTALAFDANGDLFIGNNVSGSPAVYEIANTGTTGAFASHGSAQAVINSNTLFGGTALASVNGLAFGPNGTLYITDTGNARVVSFNASNNSTAVTSAIAANGLQTPAGIAVDSSGNLYVADSGAKNVFVFYAAGGISALASAQSPIPGVTEPTGVAVDASGSVLVADGQSGNIEWIPDVSGTLSTATAITIEPTPLPQASSLWMDAKGDLYIASADGKEAYAIQRSQASVNFGTVVDGNSSSTTVFFENTGNEATTLSASAITGPGNSLFSLVAGSTDPCGSSLSMPVAGYCEMTAGFSPITGTAAGAITTSGAINYSPSNSATINLSGTAATSSLPVPIISFTPPGTALIGQQLNLSSYASDTGSVTSTSPITFIISPSSPCAGCASLSGSTLTALSAGTINIVANQAGNSSYAAAAPVTATITIQTATTPGGVPALFLNQATFIGDFCAGYCGGFTSGNNPAGGSIAVNSLGDVIDGDTYGNNIQIWAPSSSGYTQTTVKNGGAGGAAVDAANNIYAAYLYYPQIWKVPFKSGAYVTTEPSPVPSCVGTGGSSPDTTPCDFNLSGFVNSEPGVTATAIDTNGNLFIVAEPNTTTGLNGIYMIPAASLTSISNGNITVTPIYTSDPYTISSITFDANNNLFFTDSNFTNISADESTSVACGGPPATAVTTIALALNYSVSNASNLYELASTGAGTYATTPVVLQSFNSNQGCYDNAMSGVAADRTDGIVYFSTIQNGIWAFANNGTPFTSSSLPTFYAVAGPNGTSSDATNMTGAKGLAVGAPGTLYAVGEDSSSDDLYELNLGNAVAPLTPLNTTSTISAVVVDNAFGCGNAATLAISSTNPVFAATGGATCSSIAAGSGTFGTPIAAVSSYPASITFSPTVGGSQSATLSMSDTTNGGTGSANVTGVGQETPQTITFTAPTTTTYTYSSALQIPLNATGGGSNNAITFSIDSSSTGAGTISGNTLTVTQAGTITIDANQPGGLANGVYYEPAPQVQLTLTINKASQAISFAPPSSPVTYAPGLTVTLSATGGASGDAIVFSVAPSSTGNGTISGNTLTVTQAGTITIDANQAGNVNYLAATPVQQSLVVNQASQSITFVPITQPFHSIAGGGATLVVQAAGGASDQPIVFAVDASSTMQGSFSTSTVSGTTSTATLTLPAQTATTGTIVIDATQPGNANYSAAAQVQETINVLAALPTQTITFNNPGTQVTGTPLTLAATASSGFPVSYTATPSSVCTVAQSGTTWSATFVATGTCSITASQPGDNQYYAAAPSITQSFTVNPKGQVPAMALDFSSSTINLQPGTNGITQLTISSTNNFTGQVSFACSGLPSGDTCTFNPNPITVAAGGSATTTLTVTSSSTAALHRQPRPFYPVATFAVALCLLGFRRRNRLYMLLLVAISVIGFGLLSGCGGSSTTSSTTQVTSTNVTVTATSGSVQQSTTLTILVQ